MTRGAWAAFGSGAVLARPTTSDSLVSAAGKLPLGVRAVVPAAPSGWTIVLSHFGASPGETIGVAVCPTGTVVWGGGVEDNQAALGEGTVHSSYPSGSGDGWEAVINNDIGGEWLFGVYAVCAAKPKHYSIQTACGFSPSAGQDDLSASCPLSRRGKPFKALGGGGDGLTQDLSQNINSSYPSSGAWNVHMNNPAQVGASFAAFVVCGAVKGYKLVHGTAVTNPVGARTTANALCPTGTTTVGGGGSSASTSTAVNTNSTLPYTDGSGWTVLEDNSSTSDTQITPYAVCVP